MIGYKLGGRRVINAIFMEKAPDYAFCSRCHGAIDVTYAPSSLNISHKIDDDILYTHDLRLLFSLRFVEIFNNAIHNCLIKKVTQDGRYFYVLPSRTVPYDANRRKPLFGPICPQCRKHEEVTGPEPFMLALAELPGEGIFKTDIEFSGYAAKHSLLIASSAIANRMQGEKLKGLVLSPVYGTHEDVVTKTGVRFQTIGH